MADTGATRLAIEKLPELFVGPLVRHLSQQQLCLWFVTKQILPIRLQVCSLDSNNTPQDCFFDRQLTELEIQQLPVGRQAVINLVTVDLQKPLAELQRFCYQLFEHQSDTPLIPDSLRYQPNMPVHCQYTAKLTDVLHGSCRKPHGDGEDALLRVDDIMQQAIEGSQPHPSLLMMSGDQVYLDDVCGPMLDGIHQVIDALGLFDEQWQGGVVNDSQGLFASDACYYQRDNLLPTGEHTELLQKHLFRFKRKPIFTSVNSQNHIVTLSETLAMYFLVWSDQLWPLVSFDPQKVPQQWQARYQQEQDVLQHFIEGLGRVRRMLAHIPSYMIFDDHDVTDDFNLTREWEEVAYGHPLSKRIIGNALVGYLLCQGWGNQPQKFSTLLPQLNATFTTQGVGDIDQLIDTLYDWNQWHYSLATEPPMVVLDTRTQRWRSESNPKKPSGLMDWESLTALQQELIGHPAVIMVSAAPVYGVKFIETVQRVFTAFGQALMVDAENWMAHPGTANVMLNMFKHPKTPPHFLILSGDVHYSFLYRVTPRRKSDLTILQITASGLKNTFPERLLRTFEWCNRVFFAKHSPFVWFTKRRKMKVQPIKPNCSQQTLVNQCAIGRVKMDWQQATVDVSVESTLTAVQFPTQHLKQQ